MKTMFYFWFFGPVIKDGISKINVSGIFDAFFGIPYILPITLCCLVIPRIIIYFLKKYYEKKGE
jgi:hypothetical protein